MENLTITKESAVKAYSEASKNGKILLENLLGRKTFITKIEDRIKSIDDAVKELGSDDPEVIEYLKLEAFGINSHILYYQMAIVICKALNEGWTPNWDDYDEYKYYPYFNMESSCLGSFFSSYDCGHLGTLSNVGSRLAFRSSALAKYAGTQFEDVFKKFMTI